MEGQEGQEQQQQQPQALDQEALGKLLEERLAAGLRQYRQEEEAARAQAEQQRQLQEQQRQQQEQWNKDAFGQLVVPYVQPAVQQLAFQNQDNRDFMDFYTSHPEALERKSAIEAKRSEMVGRGVNVNRETILEWMVGHEKLQKDREAALQEAQKASLLSPGLAQRDTLVAKGDPRDWTQEERRRFLEPLSF